jgi:predicted DNA-binding transcriptional regulator AlpA
MKQSIDLNRNENRAANSAANPPTHDANLLTEKQVSQRLSLSLATLRRWRVDDRGPKFRKLGSCCRYSVADIDAWLESRPSGGETAPKEGRVA